MSRHSVQGIVDRVVLRKMLEMETFYFQLETNILFSFGWHSVVRMPLSMRRIVSGSVGSSLRSSRCSSDVGLRPLLPTAEFDWPMTTPMWAVRLILALEVPDVVV